MLEKLRAKPDHIKKSISIAFTIVIFSGILFVWMSSWDARSREGDTLQKTVTPLSGITSMFDGLMMDVKDAISGAPAFIKTGDLAPTASTTPVVATSTSNFDFSGVVIIDATSTAKQ